MKKKLKLLFMILLIFMILIVCYSRYIEPERLVVKEITVETDMDIEKCRIVFFTDTHFGALYDKKHIERIVNMINGRDADIVIFGGDLLDKEIVSIVRRRHDINIGHKTAEILKNNLSYVLQGIPRQMKAYGIHAVTGLPVFSIISSYFAFISSS